MIAAPDPKSPLRRALADRRGGVAVIFAIAVPVIAALACGAVDLMGLRASRSALQDAADAAALAAARQIGLVDKVGVQPRAAAFIAAQTATAVKDVKYSVSASVDEKTSTVTVSVDGVRDSFFGNLLPPGGWKIHISSVASRVNQVPLCVLSTGKDAANKIDMKDTAQLTAPKCLVQSNGDIEVGNAGWLQTAIAQAVGTAKGRITPDPQTDAPAIEDPFASIAIKSLGKCNLIGGLGGVVVNITQLVPGLNVLAPGAHCGNIVVQDGMTVRLQPGEHYFKSGRLELKKGSKLEGTDVVMLFDKDADFKFGETSEIRLEGRRSGSYAGFVIATTLDNSHVFDISTTSAKSLLGTIYIPNATLSVSGTANKVNDQADWTVIVAKSLQMTGSPNLVLNTNYQGSPVPVPPGVGPMGSARLTQ